MRLFSVVFVMDSRTSSDIRVMTHDGGRGVLFVGGAVRVTHDLRLARSLLPSTLHGFDGPSSWRQSLTAGEPAMDWSHLDLNPKVVAAVKQANIQSMKEILCLSGPDLQRLTKLSSSDVQYLHKTVAATIKRDPVVTALQIYNGECPFPTQNQKLSMGCPVVDSLLGGGIPLMGITEIVGESSAGKTQICMQLSLSVQFPCSYGGQDAGAVYICTEDTFPNKRLQQLIAFQSMLRTDVPPDIVNNIKFGNNIFIEHVADVESLNHCISKRLPVLLSRRLIRLVVIDSIAALFRCEFGVSDSIAKAKCLQKFGAMLHHLSHQFSSPVICVNQITDVVNDSHLPQGNFGQV